MTHSLLSFSPERFAVPLKFETNENGGIGDQHPDLAQNYKLSPIAHGQKRLIGRAVLMPELNLTRYRVDAVVDWVVVSVETESKQQPVNVEKWVKSITGEALYTAGPDGQERYSGRQFEMKIQDPTPERLDQMLATIDRDPRLSSSRKIAAIEVSVDWYALSRNEADRLLVTDLLWRHLFPQEEVWRRTKGWPRCFDGKEGGARAKRKDTKDFLRLPDKSMREALIDYVGIQLQPKPEMMRNLTLGFHVQPALAARLCDIAEFLRQFQNAQTLFSKLASSVPLARRRCSSHGRILLSKNSTERRLSGQLKSSLVQSTTDRAS